MLVTEYGTFDGNSWEDICQKIFKRKYGDANYQEMPASPGDYGIEGVIKSTGVAIQCYCPNQHYTQKELYVKQRSKITEDLNKLKEYEAQIKVRIGEEKISKWIFLTPVINDNDLLRHATTKTQEIRSWNLDILDGNVEVIIQDAAFYATDLREIQVSQGDKVSFLSLENATLEKFDPEQLTDYDDNIRRKIN